VLAQPSMWSVRGFSFWGIFQSRRWRWQWHDVIDAVITWNHGIRQPADGPPVFACQQTSGSLSARWTRCICWLRQLDLKHAVLHVLPLIHLSCAVRTPRTVPFLSSCWQKCGRSLNSGIRLTCVLVARTSYRITSPLPCTTTPLCGPRGTRTR
jgi:hypothetical protein